MNDTYEGPPLREMSCGEALSRIPALPEIDHSCPECGRIPGVVLEAPKRLPNLVATAIAALALFGAGYTVGSTVLTKEMRAEIDATHQVAERVIAQQRANSQRLEALGQKVEQITSERGVR